MLDFDMPMTLVVFFALFGMMSLTMVVAAIIAKLLDKALNRWDSYQHAKAIARMFRN